MCEPNQLTFTKNLIGTSFQFSLSSEETNPAEIINLIATNANLSEINSGTLTRLVLKAERASALQFPGVLADGSVRVEGGVSAIVGFYPTGEQALESIGFTEAARMHGLPSEQKSRYGVLAWEYDMNASAKAGMALSGTIKARISLDGQKGGNYAVLRHYSENDQLKTAINELVQAWKTPAQIASAEDLPVHTCVVTEVYGGIRFAIDSSLGLDFNWVREVPGSKVSGDIGLKLMLGLQTQFGFEIDGKFVLWILREKHDSTLRLKLHRVKSRGWNFALGLRAHIKSELPLPEDPDDLIQAMLGVHGERIIRDLKALERWTSPETPPIGPLAGITASYLKGLLEEVTGFNPDAKFEQVRSAILNWIAKWEDIPQSATALLWKWAQDQGALAKAKEIAKTLAQADESAVREAVRALFGRLAPHRDEGFLLAEQLAGGALSEVLRNARALKALRQNAENVLRILDGSQAEELLRKLKVALEARLNIRSFLEGAPDSADEWLAAKIERLVGDKLGDKRLERLEEVRGTIREILSRKDELYKKVREAALSQYSFALAASYERTSETSVLVDAEFDTNVPEAREELKKAIRGDFTGIFTGLSSLKGVTVHSGSIAQGLRRTTSVKLSLPWTTHAYINTVQAIAKGYMVGGANGKEIVFELEAEDKIEKRAASRFALASALSIGLAAGRHLQDGEAPIVYDRDSGCVSYALRFGRKRMKAAELSTLLKITAAKYFTEEFCAAYEGRTTGTVEDFVSELDRRVDAELENGENMLGDTLVELVLEYPGHVLEGWLKAPERSSDPVYRRLSAVMQKGLKETLLDVFLAEPTRLKHIGAAAPILVWASLPPAVGGGKQLYWNWPDQVMRRNMVWRAETQERLRTILRSKVVPLLEESSDPALVKLARDYRVEHGAVKDLIQETLHHGLAQFESLLYVEATVIDEAVRAGMRIAHWMKVAKKDWCESVKRLAQFGESVVSTFHGKLSSIYARDVMRSLGPRLLIEAGRVFEGQEESATVEPFATLYIGVLKEKSNFTVEQFTQGAWPSADAMLVEVQLVNLPDEAGA